MSESSTLDLRDAKGPLSLRLTAEQRAALEWHRRVFPEKYPSVGSVLTDNSLTEAVASYRRAQQSLGAAA
jgi:hypothetical protein